MLFEFSPKASKEGLEEWEIGGWIKIIQATALLRAVWILKRVLETCSLLDSSERPSANTVVKIFQEIIIISRKLESGTNNSRTNNNNSNNNNKTQQNSKCTLCSDRDETINHIISECSKLAQKEYKTRRDWVGKVIHWEMCKKFKFDHTNKRYMHNPAPVLESNTHQLLWDFNIQTDHLIPARRFDLIIINNKREPAKL